MFRALLACVLLLAVAAGASAQNTVHLDARVMKKYEDDLIKMIDVVSKRVLVAKVRELRLSGKKENVKKARELMDKMRGTDKQPGGARKSVLALVEHAKLLQVEEKWQDSFQVWRPLVVQLGKGATNDDRTRELYFDCYFNLILCSVKIGQAKAEKADRDKAIDGAAHQIIQFEESWEDFGNKASKKRFTELLDAEPKLKAKYLALKAKK